ncbi:glycosyltransferase family 25 protein [Vibrio genomosp. F10 str. 9ZC157]|uniref:3-deoxy-D-manno-octulosonic acid transferase n=1 Tax=Vibrio genomosp. F10 str. ZF-129 TaxID=1187848 RepID=A0A1E5BD84_9VIBR|nr:glycosyltransferase family 25 protein [Vibrio genomosp. F10]OEE33093.1 3-deoxy-D-manno-octulosonic acid transferase [Vibrio genomosp. F10 str. ZF-129]OEE95594.1 3-deoxy-D-manno-octulosonic acid transferase [Vibrio genomosp. F10 str. 9ZC157]
MIKTFVIHVSKGYEERRKHIDKHLPERGITDYEYMLRGDIDDLSDEIRNEFFDDSLRLPEKSCFYKHYLVMKKVIEEQIPQVLVLEDDALLVKGFDSQLKRILKEMEGKTNYLVNIEDAASSVPYSYREKDQLTYSCKTNKLTGGLVYDISFAKKLVSYIESSPVCAPIDGFIGNENDRLGYSIHWCQPPLVSQGSKNGMFASELNGAKSGLYIRLRSAIKDFYRRDIRSHLSKKHKALFQNINKH